MDGREEGMRETGQEKREGGKDQGPPGPFPRKQRTAEAQLKTAVWLDFKRQQHGSRDVGSQALQQA